MSGEDAIGSMISRVRSTTDATALPPPVSAPTVDLNDAIARAKALAAKLAGGGASSTGTSDGAAKRKRWEDSEDPTSGAKRRIVPVPVAEHPYLNWPNVLRGPSGAQLANFEHEAGCRIYLRGREVAAPGSSDPDDRKDLHVVISASDDASLQKATKLVEDVIFNATKNGAPSSALTTTGRGGSDSVEHIDIPAALVGFVIGRGGENVREIQLRTGADIQIEREFESTNPSFRRITIRGKSERVASAKASIENMIAERKDRAASERGREQFGTGFATETMQIPNERVGMIIGRQGATIKGIQDRTRTDVQIPRDIDPAHPQYRTITISGPSHDAVAAAKKEIITLLDDGRSGSGGHHSLPPGHVVEYLQIPHDTAGLVIGRGGSTISDLQSRTGTHIQVPPNADPTTGGTMRTIEITGPPQGCAMAKSEIHALAYGGASSTGLTASTYGGGGMGAYPAAAAPAAYGGGYDYSAYQAYYAQMGGAGAPVAAAAPAPAAAPAAAAATDPAAVAAAWRQFYAAQGYDVSNWDPLQAMQQAAAGAGGAPGASGPGAAAGDSGERAPGT